MQTMLLPVSVESWQIECCWEPFRIGEHVHWRLMFVEQGRFEPEPEQQVELTAHAEPFSWEDGEQDRAGIRLCTAAAVLYWSPPEPITGAVTVVGSVWEDHHAGVPEDFPVTAAVIRRLRVETREYTEDPPHSGGWVRVGSTASYRDVSMSPKRFAGRAADIGPACAETGVLADLEITA